LPRGFCVRARVSTLATKKEGAAEWRGHHERGSRPLLRIMVYLSLRLGRRVTRGALYAIAGYYFLLARGARRHIRRYLRLALHREPAARDEFRLILNFARTIHDRVYLINGRDDLFEVTLEGEDLMRRQLHSGHGAFLLGAHLGSFEIMRTVGRRQPGLRVSMAMYEENARKISAALAAISPRETPDIVALGHIDAMLKLRDRLERGIFVGMLADRTLGQEPMQAVEILGARAHLPTGPLRAAAILRRPVIFMVGLYRGGNRYHAVFEPLADFSATPVAEREAAIRQAVERYAGLIDRFCRSDPYNWFNFFDFWPLPGAAAEP